MLTSGTTVGNIDPLKQTELWKNLYNLTAMASDAFTINDEAIKIYTKSCAEYNEHLKKNLLGGVVNLGLCGLLTAFSASTLNVTIDSALAMPAMPALAILLGLPTTSVSAILLSSLSIVLGVSGVFFLGLGLYSWIKKRAAQKKVDGFEKGMFLCIRMIFLASGGARKLMSSLFFQCSS